MNSNNVMFIAISAAVVAVVYALFKSGKIVGDTATTFSQGVRAILGDTAFTGPPVTQSQGALLSREDYINRGYLTVDAYGRSVITPAGNAYIESQNASSTRLNETTGTLYNSNVDKPDFFQ